MHNGYARLLFLWIATLPSILWAQVNAEFSANQTEGCGSLQVSFQDLSTSDDGIIVGWQWDLGGVASTQKNPGRIFSNSGSYEICLTVTDSNGDSDTECKPAFIIVRDLPEPDFSADVTKGCAPLEVNFEDLTTGGGEIVSWIWGVGGSSGVITDDGSLTEISSIYDTPDKYTVSLSVIDEFNCTNTITRDDYIDVGLQPDVNISATNVFGCEPPHTANFEFLGSSDGLEINWDFWKTVRPSQDLIHLRSIICRRVALQLLSE